MQLLSLFVVVSGAVDDVSAGDGDATRASSVQPVQVAAVDGASAAHCARSDKLVGSNCSYSTGAMARRVVEEGQDWGWEGSLTETANNLSSSVAAPFCAGAGTHVIANELVETLSSSGLLRSNLSLSGKLLEVDGVRYVVVTSYKVLSS